MMAAARLAMIMGATSNISLRKEIKVRVSGEHVSPWTRRAPETGNQAADALEKPYLEMRCAGTIAELVIAGPSGLRDLWSAVAQAFTTRGLYGTLKLVDECNSRLSGLSSDFRVRLEYGGAERLAPCLLITNYVTGDVVATAAPSGNDNCSRWS